MRIHGFSSAVLNWPNTVCIFSSSQNLKPCSLSIMEKELDFVRAFLFEFKRIELFYQNINFLKIFDNYQVNCRRILWKYEPRKISMLLVPTRRSSTSLHQRVYYWIVQNLQWPIVRAFYTIGLACKITWPHTIKFFFWGSLKKKVHAKFINDKEDFRQRVVWYTQELNPVEIEAATTNVVTNRILKCIY